MATEVFGHGIIGGFGKIVLDLGNELIKKGVDVSVISWRSKGQPKVDLASKFPIFGALRPSNNSPFFLHISSYAELISLAKLVNADLYINIELKSLSNIVQLGEPHKKHVIWFQDPYDECAYKTMALVDRRFSWNFSRKMHFFATLSWTRKACQRADSLVTQAMDFIPIIKRLYKPRKPIDFLPNPVSIPKRQIKKASEPTVCFLGRWDPQKRVELFLKLSKKFREVKFIAIGKSNFPNSYSKTRKKFEGIENLEMPGFVSEEEKSLILEKSWVLINTSIREGLPINFLEACAHKTALLSYVNPDGYASRFGYWARKEDFETGLKKLLEADLWVEKSKVGFEYVSKVHSIENVTQKTIDVYARLIS